ncbi:unnamed protein product [Hymenolepis diminuta]|uniref:Uncharacterized protein n=1 Tax=Hymenolepis diminuta TaxID=6216 RepID=A0A564YL16_HYMDI|nr:unnamed protein product [Hymenolepis diminuta]
MTHNPCLSDMSKRVHRFPLFFITASLRIKRHICAHALAWPHPSDSYKATLLCPDNTLVICFRDFVPAYQDIDSRNAKPSVLSEMS